MLKRPITFKNYEGVTVTGNYYFNLTLAECVELQLAYPGGFEGFITKIMTSTEDEEGLSTENAASLMRVMKDFIKRSYGIRSGDDFLKTEEASGAFMSSEAYSSLFMDVVTDAQKGSEFINGVMPAELLQKANAQIGLSQPAEFKGQSPTLAIVDEAEEVFRPSHLDRKVEDAKKVKPKLPPTKEELLKRFKAKSYAGRELTFEEVTSMTQGELDDAIAAGAKIPEL